MKIMTVIFALAAAAILLAADPPNETKALPTVRIDNFSFIPQTLTIPAGAKVTWVNRDDVPHTVRSVGKKFKSGVPDTDEQFSYTFSALGTNDYYCSVHPHMTGRIIVR